MPRLLFACFALALIGCAAAGRDPADLGAVAGGSGGESAGSGAGGNPTLSSVGVGGGASSCKHSTYTYSGPGPDGVFGTKDDVAKGTHEIDFDMGANDLGLKTHPIAMLMKDAKGQPTLFQKWTYDSKGVRERITQYGPGADSQYDTADDVVQGMNVYTIDASGLVVNAISRSGPGPNGVWGDADDVIGASLIFIREGGRVVWILFATNPGPNGIWADADDLYSNSQRIEYDAKGNASGFDVSLQPGPDAVFGSPDDIISFRTVYPCRGDRVVEETSGNPGPDGVWGTPDDVMLSRAVESGDLCASASCEAPVPLY